MSSVTIPRSKQPITIFASSFVRDKKDLSITDSAKVEKIVDYSFERNDRANVLAIHPTKPLIAYLINIQRTQKISKAWASSYDQQQQHKTPDQSSDQTIKNKTVSIRILDYESRQRCLAKGIYHARPADCVFTINSTLCSQSDVIKLAIVDKLANIYLYDLSYYINDLTASRVAVIRGPSQDVSPLDSIHLVWCPFVPCEDFDDGDGGLRLALATDHSIEIFAMDRLQPGKGGEMQRQDLKGVYKSISNAHESNIVSLSISPDCSTISAAAEDNGVKFFASDIDDHNQRCLHNWKADITDNSSISKLFFLDDYPKLLKDSTMQFWGAAFIATKNGQMILIDLKTWSVYQSVTFIIETGPKNFDYRIDLRAKCVIAINGNQAFVVQIDHDICNSGKGIENANSELVNGSPYSLKASPMKTSTPDTLNSATILPRIVKITRFGLHNPIYSFAVKHKSEDELELFTISAYSLEKFIINLSQINDAEETPTADEPRPNAATPHELKRFLEQFDGNLRISSSNTNNAQATNNTSNNSGNISKISTPTKASTVAATLQPGHSSMTPHIQTTVAMAQMATPSTSSAATIHTLPNMTTSILNNSKSSMIQPAGLDPNNMDRLVTVLFNKLNTAFSQGLEEFLNDVKSEVNDLKLKLNVLCRDVRKLQQQLHDHRN